MRGPEGDAWEAAYWDDFIKEFGTEAYVHIRFIEGQSFDEEVEKDDARTSTEGLDGCVPDDAPPVRRSSGGSTEGAGESV